MTAPTPGPLHYKATAGAHDFDIYGDDGRSLALVRNRDEASESLAALIAAAPDLLAFVERVAALEDRCRREGGRAPTFAEWAILAPDAPEVAARAKGGAA